MISTILGIMPFKSLYTCGINFNEISVIVPMANINTYREYCFHDQLRASKKEINLKQLILTLTF